MTTTSVPNAEFAKLASAERIAAVAEALNARGMQAEIFEDGAAVRARVFELIPEGAQVYTPLSRTMDELGISTEIDNSDRYQSLRKETSHLSREERKSRAGRMTLASPDYMVGSVHAITEKGQVLIASGSGSQLAGYVYGASHVIWVVGTHKIVRDMDEGMRRLWEYSLPLESARMQALYGMPSGIAKVLLFEREQPGRINVLLVNEALGF